jgi:hypothetical protein
MDCGSGKTEGNDEAIGVWRNYFNREQPSVENSVICAVNNA